MARGDTERSFVSNDCQQLRAIYDGLPADHVAEYLELLGTADGLRGPLDACRATSKFSDPVDAETQSDPLPPITVPTLFL